MKIDICDELSTLTTIDLLYIKRLAQKVRWCLSDAIEQAISNNETQVEADVGIGTIIITIFDGAVKYKFIPDKLTDKQVVSTIVNGRNELQFELEKNLVQKITNIYKDML